MIVDPAVSGASERQLMASIVRILLSAACCWREAFTRTQAGGHFNGFGALGPHRASPQGVPEWLARDPCSADKRQTAISW